MTLTIATIAEQVVAAADDTRKQDAATLRQARTAIEQATAGITQPGQSAPTPTKEKRYALHATGIAIAATVLVMATISGVDFHEPPASWLVPKRIVVRVLRLDRSRAGERLSTTADPERWRTVLLSTISYGATVMPSPRAGGHSAQATKPVKCSIRIGSPLH